MGDWVDDLRQWRSGVRLMIAGIFEELSGRVVGVLIGLVLGALITWLYGRWKRYKQRQSILKGDARDTVVINQHLVESAEGPGGNRVPAMLRMRIWWAFPPH